MPMTFYGRVLDQNHDPVVGATVAFQWTDTSAKGTSNYQTTTDGKGFFKLENVRGKNLGVQIHKEGYFASASNPRGFEYAAFFDSTYHIPNLNNPVIFRMHKAGPAEQLVARDSNIKIPDNGSIKVNLLTGRQDESNAHLIIDLLYNSDRTGRSWMARLRVPNGGIQQTTDEFATLAPESGYHPEVTIDQNSPQPNGQSGNLYKGGRFYLRTPAGYALVDVRMIPGNKSLRLSSYINSNSNSRNLEHD